MSMNDWMRHGDTNCGPGMVYDSSEEKEIAQLKAQLKAANERAKAMEKALRERNDQIIDWCNVLDKAGEEFQFDPSKDEDQNAADYFCTVSKNAGLARLVCELSNADLAAKDHLTPRNT